MKQDFSKRRVPLAAPFLAVAALSLSLTFSCLAGETPQLRIEPAQSLSSSASNPVGTVQRFAQLDAEAPASSSSIITLAQPADIDTEEQAALADRQTAALPTVSPYLWSATHDADGITLMGHVPVDSLKRFLAVRAGDTAVDTSELAAGAPPDFAADSAAGLQAVLALQEGEVSYDGTRWRLNGRAESQSARDALLAELTSATDTAAWTIEVAAVETPSATSSADLPGCAATVAELSARNGILFQSGAALIAPQSEPALDVLALELAGCSDAIVHVEGHTDSDGEDRQNMALSVARAEAVVQALVERGVNAQRLYAIGYGETAPIASNDTAEGKRLNRRIVVAVQAEEI